MFPIKLSRPGKKHWKISHWNSQFFLKINLIRWTIHWFHLGLKAVSGKTKFSMVGLWIFGYMSQSTLRILVDHKVTWERPSNLFYRTGVYCIYILSILPGCLKGNFQYTPGKKNGPQDCPRAISRASGCNKQKRDQRGVTTDLLDV